jgi:hypothetical protein
LTVSYSNNTDAGSATANASYAGDANHEAGSSSTTFTIGKASSTVTVTCPTSVTYNGSAQTPCTAAATGAGGLDQVLTVSYSNNTNVGSATANASYAGDANHEASSGSATFTIGKASSTVTVTCPAIVTYTGSAQTPCTAAVAGAGGLNQALTVSYVNNTNAGSATANASYAGDTNHEASSGSATFTINPLRFEGFYPKLGPAAVGKVGTATVYGPFSLGSVIAVKWALYDANNQFFAGDLDLSGKSNAKIELIGPKTASGYPSPILLLAPGSVPGSTVFRISSGQYIFNWDTTKTKSTAGYYILAVTDVDGGVHSVTLQIK